MTSHIIVYMSHLAGSVCSVWKNYVLWTDCAESVYLQYTCTQWKMFPHYVIVVAPFGIDERCILLLNFWLIANLTFSLLSLCSHPCSFHNLFFLWADGRGSFGKKEQKFRIWIFILRFTWFVNKWGKSWRHNLQNSKHPTRSETRIQIKSSIVGQEMVLFHRNA